MNGFCLKKQLSLICLVFALALSGCAPAEPPEPETPAEELGISSSAEEPTEAVSLPSTFSLPYLSQKTLDPITCPDGVQQTVSALLYEGLFELDPQLAVQERLCAASSYDGALTWSFTLRTDVTFSDGSPLTAADAAATLQRAMGSSRYGVRLSGVQSISASGSVVTVNLLSANAGLPALLDIPIVKAGTETDLVPVGTGPYRMNADETGVYLSANPTWWRGSGQPAERITLLSSDSTDAIRYQFFSHAVQLIATDLTGISPISATGSFDFQDVDTTVLQYVGFNVHRAPLSDPALRSALGLGIDRSAVVSAYLSGHARATQFPVSPVSALYPVGLEKERYAYTAYESAMTAAGYHTGTVRKLTMLVNEESSFKTAIARYLAAAFSAFDLEVTVVPLPWAEYTARLAAGNFDLYYGEVRLTADWDLRPLVATGGSLNYGGYANPAVDLLVNQYASATDRKAAMSSLCRTLQAQSPILPVCFKRTSVLSQADVITGLHPTAANPFYDLSACTIHLAKD